ncbi:WhiB family transcriptional regulator [Streptomyces luteogriseus]|uniref:WhiB family transcriptional regulator n=1 Tax=Streptomyces luteogriseus TaxID=68233 RepID=UPI0037A46F34
MVLLSRVHAPDWTAAEDSSKEAKCRKLPVPVFGEDPFFDDEQTAMAVCNGGDSDAPYENAGAVCPRRHECLVFALINHEMSGVWGGMLLHDRMNLKRNVRREWWRWHPPTPKPEKPADRGSAPQAA